MEEEKGWGGGEGLGRGGDEWFINVQEVSLTPLAVCFYHILSTHPTSFILPETIQISLKELL